MATAKGTAQLGVGIDAALMTELRAFSESRGEKIRAVVEAALRRHMDNPPPQVPPPPPTYPPLPPVTVPGADVVTKPAAKKPTPKKKGGKG